MRIRTALAALALALPVVAGCSTTDSRPDRERIVGERTGTSVNVRVGSGSAALSVPVVDLEGIEPGSESEFTAGGQATITLRFPDTLTFSDGSGGDITIDLPPSVSISGTYTLDEDRDRVTIARADIGGEITLRYGFRGSDGLELIAESDDTFAALIGVAVGPEYQTLARAIDGGSIRFDG